MQSTVDESHTATLEEAIALHRENEILWINALGRTLDKWRLGAGHPITFGEFESIYLKTQAELIAKADDPANEFTAIPDL